MAREIYEAAPTCLDLDARAADFVNTDRQVPTAADALFGAGHIIAEHVSEQAELRGRLREVLQRTGALVSSRIAAEEKPPQPGEAKPQPSRNAVSKAHGLQPVGVGVGMEAVQPVSVEHTHSAAAAPPASTMELLQPLSVTSLQSADAESLHQLNTEAGEADLAVASGADVAAAGGADIPVCLRPAEMPAPPATEPPSVELLQPLSVTSLQPLSAEPPQSLNTVSLRIAGSPPPAAAQRKLARQQAKQAALNKRDEKRKKLEEKKIKAFRDYFQYREEIKKIPPHRVLAINRGERAKVLRVRIESDLQAMVNVLEEMVVPPGHPHAEYLRGCTRDALNRLILPSLEREVRRELTDHAETHAVGVFARNLRNLLLQPPVRNYRLLAVDPGFRSGCKLAALDEFGNLLDHGVIYLVSKPDRRDEARQKVLELIDRLQLSVVVIGNGTACRHTEDFFAELVEKELKERGVAYVIVNEAGASVYSTSHIGREEFPQYDATLRGAISIGRRLQDPLSELVKIDPANIGVGLYQHDVKAKHLQNSLDDVVESCVNYVGVDVNTASPALLRYVSGLNQLTARRLYEYRREHGPFRARQQLREVPGFGEATFVQAAGFLKILDGDNPLDSTWIHPESYPAANRALERLQAAAADLRDKETAAALAERIAGVNVEVAGRRVGRGRADSEGHPDAVGAAGRDPREDLPAPVFKRGVIKLEDLAPNMELTGTVLNVVDFGCFVDIGMHQSGLVHVSRLADKFVRDPHDVVAVGDIVKVWVMGIDKERQRVSLTMIPPGTERARPPQRAPGGGRTGQARPAGDGAPAQGEHRGRQRPPRPEGQQRPPRPAGQAGQQRPPRPQGERRPPRPQGGSQDRGRPPREYNRPPPRPRPTPRPLIPITDEMKTGKEPMRTFGDLLQFYQHKTVTTADEQPPTPAEQPSAIVEQPPTATAETSVAAEPAATSDEAPAAADASRASEQSPAVADQAPIMRDEGSV